MKSWAERVQAPGAPPPRPADKPPVAADERQSWDEAVWTWNDYVCRLRRFEMATALDRILKARAADGPPDYRALETIVMNVAASVMDGTILEPAFRRMELIRWPL